MLRSQANAMVRPRESRRPSPPDRHRLQPPTHHEHSRRCDMKVATATPGVMAGLEPIQTGRDCDALQPPTRTRGQVRMPTHSGQVAGRVQSDYAIIEWLKRNMVRCDEPSHCHCCADIPTRADRVLHGAGLTTGNRDLNHRKPRHLHQRVAEMRSHGGCDPLAW